MVDFSRCSVQRVETFCYCRLVLTQSKAVTMTKYSFYITCIYNFSLHFDAVYILGCDITIKMKSTKVQTLGGIWPKCIIFGLKTPLHAYVLG